MNRLTLVTLLIIHQVWLILLYRIIHLVTFSLFSNYSHGSVCNPVSFIYISS
jgi:hypothetical protein